MSMTAPLLRCCWIQPLSASASTNFLDKLLRIESSTFTRQKKTSRPRFFCPKRDAWYSRFGVILDFCSLLVHFVRRPKYKYRVINLSSYLHCINNNINYYTRYCYQVREVICHIQPFLMQTNDFPKHLLTLFICMLI
jgi:hypothetical protein